MTIIDIILGVVGIVLAFWLRDLKEVSLIFRVVTIATAVIEFLLRQHSLFIRTFWKRNKKEILSCLGSGQLPHFHK